MNLPRRLLPSIASLRALEALDRLGSASAVAEELNLTQGAISRQLQTLERQLGVTLIDRDHKRLALNGAAQRYAAEMRDVLHRIANASLTLQVQPTRGALNLAILPTFGMRWLMPRLPDFARLHPEVDLNMSTRIVPFNFAAENFDAALHFGDADWPGSGQLLLRHESVIAVAQPDVAKRYNIKTAQDLLDLPLMHIQTRPTAWADWFRQKGVTPRGPLPGTMYDQFSTMTQAALVGLGVALMPDYLVEEDIALGRLTAVCGEAIETTGAYYLVWPHARAFDPSLLAFRNWLATQAEPEDRLPR